MSSKSPASRHSEALAALPALLDSIYGAALYPHQWPEVVEQIRVAVGASNAELHAHGDGTGQAAFLHSSQIALTDFTEWSQVAASDMWLNNWIPSGQPEDDVFLPRRDVPLKNFARTEAYQEWYRPRDIADCAGLALVRGRAHRIPKVHFWCSQGPGRAFTQDHAALLRALGPHLRRALHVDATLKRGTAATLVSYAVFEKLAAGVVLVGQDQRVLYVNEAAERMLEAADGLSIVRGHLVAAAAVEHATLTGMLGQAIAAKRPRCLGTMLLPRPSGKDALQISVLVSAAASQDLADAQQIGAMLILTDPASQAPVPTEVLARRYQLTRTETRVLLALASGLSRSAIAEQQGTSLRTVRMHLSHLFLKTGAKRQAELVRLALTSPASPLLDR